MRELLKCISLIIILCASQIAKSVGDDEISPEVRETLKSWLNSLQHSLVNSPRKIGNKTEEELALLEEVELLLGRLITPDGDGVKNICTINTVFSYFYRIPFII